MTVLPAMPDACFHADGFYSSTDVFIAYACDMHFFGDAEAITFSINTDGMPSFAKDGEYEGGKLGAIEEYAGYIPPLENTILPEPIASVPTQPASNQPVTQQANVFSQPVFLGGGFFGSSSSTTTETIKKVIERETVVLPHSDVPAVPLPGGMGLLPAALFILMIAKITSARGVVLPGWTAVGRPLARVRPNYFLPADASSDNYPAQSTGCAGAFGGLR